MNVKPSPVPEALKDIVGWLPAPVDRNALAAEIANQLPLARDSLDYYRSRSLALGRDVRFLENGAWQDARAEEISEDGGLVVRLPDGRRRTLQSGEISLRLV